MNFLTKNLGWILLLIFFIFMLFIISTSNTPVNTSSGSIETGSGDETNADETLDELINMLDGETESASGETNEELNQDASTGSLFEEVDEEVQEDTGGFFSFLRGNKDKEKEKDEDEFLGEETNSGSTLEAQEDGTESTNTINQDISDNESEVVVSSSDGLVKNTDQNTTTYNDVSAYETYMANLPGNDIVTSIGNKYTIGVKSLKLNNKYFNKNLGILYSGDVIEQIGTENSFSCFEVRILHAQNASLNGTEGYVCKKWLLVDDSKNYVDSTSSDSEIIHNNIKTPVEVTTYIGDLIIMSDLFVIVDSILLEQGDIIDQLSETDMYTGCFSALVRETDIILSRGKIITACYSAVN